MGNIKYVVFRKKASYGWVMNLELKNHTDVLLDRKIQNHFLYKINDFCTSAKVNNYFRIPFQFVWYNYYLDEKQLNSEDEIIFMFEEGSRPYLIEDYLKYLKKKYPRCHLVFFPYNSAFSYSNDRIVFFEKNYDYIVTSERKDHEERGWLYYAGVYSKLPELSLAQIKESDVFFVGSNKGRLQMLYAIYEKLSAIGLKCDFYITNVATDEIRDYSGIHFNQWLDYKEVIEKACKTNCLLEVLQKGQDGITYRQVEAVTYGIKLLTNYMNISKEHYYNPKQMSIFRSVDDIDIDFVKMKYETTAFPYDGSLSPYKRIQWLDNQIHHNQEEK